MKMNTTICQQPPPPYSFCIEETSQGPVSYYIPKYHIIFSVLASILCLPFGGLVSLIYSLHSYREFNKKNYENSNRLIKKAEFWICSSIVGSVSFALGLFFGPSIYIIIDQWCSKYENRVHV